MRTVFVGAGQVSVETAKSLSKKDHEVIIIETDKAEIDELSEEMDCNFLQGEGICYYRDGTFSHADEDTTFRIGDRGCDSNAQ